MKIMIILGCPEPPVLIPSFIYFLNLLKNSGHEVFVSANPAALKLIETADPEKYYLKGVGFQNIDEGLKNKFDVDIIIGFAHNDAAVNYIITYKTVYNSKTMALVFGKNINEEFVKTLEEENIKTFTARAFHNPTPVIVQLKRLKDCI
ncbi:DUF1890 domain-containing protein [Methanothermococcus okinawensis]|uniref:Uncharacterized conserved protein UCP006600 n=1 Tax=Methanothermococcus okinawensis (strain DSM 14208 / JCM 11175 / IH1) TaxID=647113 RepID=F8AMX0_METOI|nr:DUF1890 domain-containing protein [Methanothermococcus okinawensis]AEH06093.1 Uncharacterized conserved protein UCP006600 [Methanothermococcus okinawensis IH1]